MMKTFLGCLSVLILLTNCKKSNEGCATSLDLSADNEVPKIGESFTITAAGETINTVYQWSGPNYQDAGQSNTVYIGEAKLSNRGWYYCTVTNSDCGTSLTDSVFIDVQLWQETPPCNPANNTVTGAGLPNVNITTTQKGMHPSYNGMRLEGGAGYGYPTFEVMFNSYNGNTEPLDGTYTTKNVQIFSPFDEPNIVSVSFIYNSNYYHSHAGQKVYIKHVNGKLQATFCNMVFGSPPYPNLTCTGKITEL